MSVIALIYCAGAVAFVGARASLCESPDFDRFVLQLGPGGLVVVVTDGAYCLG